jgi:uncharacterized protein (DUF4213/DUF364 family)
MILEMNRRTIEQLSPILESHFEQIDALGQKKDEKLQKIAIFHKMTDIIQQLSENENIGGYDTLLKTIQL